MATSVERAQEEVPAASGKAAPAVPIIVAEAFGADAVDAPPAPPAAGKPGPVPQPVLGPRDVHPLHKPAQPTHEEIKASPHFPVVVTANPMVKNQVGARPGGGEGWGPLGPAREAAAGRGSLRALPPSAGRRAAVQQQRRRRRRPGRAPQAWRGARSCAAAADGGDGRRGSAAAALACSS
jgi:hypothetical protein